MAQYGSLIDDEQTFNKVTIRNLLSSYFGNPTMTKIDNVSSGSSLFAVRCDAVLNEPRYVLCLVDGTSMEVGETKKMRDILWYSLQTRQIDDDLVCGSFIYSPRGCHPFNTPLRILERKESMSLYTNEEYGFRMGLMHVDKRSEYEYPDFGTLATALETYQSLLLI